MYTVKCNKTFIIIVIIKVNTTNFEWTPTNITYEAWFAKLFKYLQIPLTLVSNDQWEMDET